MEYKQSYCPCDDCESSYSKNNQESDVCKICEFNELADKGRYIVGGGKKKKNDYTWAVNQYADVWSNARFDTIAECFEDAGEVYPERPIVGLYIGECVPYDNYKVDATMILEELENMAYEVVGEVAEDWFCSVTNEQKEELSIKMGEVLKMWLLERGFEPGFYKVENVRYVENVK